MATFSYEDATGAPRPARRRPVEVAPRAFSYDDAVGPQPAAAPPSPEAAPAAAASWGDVLAAAPGLAYQGGKNALGGIIDLLNERPAFVLPESFAEAQAYDTRGARATAAKTAAEVAGVEDKARRAAFRMQGVPQDPSSQAGLDAARAFAEAKLPGRAISNAAKDAEEATRKRLNVSPNSAKGFGLDAAIALGQMAPGVVGSMLTRSMVPALGSIAALSGGQKYAQSRQEGRLPAAAAQDAAAFAAAEAIPEMLPLGVLLKGGGKFLPRVGKAALFEGATEGITQSAQDAYDGSVLDKPMTAETMLANAARAAALGATVGGGLGAATAPFAGRSQTQTPPVPPPMVDSNGLDGAAAPAADPLANIAAILRSQGVAPESFTDPAAAAAAIDRARTRPNNAAFDVDQARQIQEGIDAGTVDPSLAPVRPQRVVPDDVSVIAAPEGNVRADDAGAMAGLERQRAAEDYVLSEAAARAADDPILAGIVADPNMSQRMKVRESYNRLMLIPEVAAARTGLRMSAPRDADIMGFYNGASRPPPRNPDDPNSKPVQQGPSDFERTREAASPTQADLAAGRVYFDDATGSFTDQAKGREPYQSRMQTGGSDRAFPTSPDDPAGQPGFWEDRARAMGEEAKAKAQADLEAKWEARRKAEEDRLRRERERAEQAKARGEEFTGNPDADPETRYRGKYSQKPGKAASGFWNVNGDGYVSGEDGTPTAFRTAKEAAKWATSNGLAGDFELHVYGPNTTRVTLRRRPGSTYGQQAPRPEGPQPPPAGRSADTSQRVLPGPPPAQPPPSAPPPPVQTAPDPTPRPVAPAPARAPIQTGRKQTVVTARGRSVDTEFEVMEADDLLTSDNEAYDPAIQPRDRSGRGTSDVQIAEIAGRLDPEQLGDSRLAAQGAPIIGPDRMVESGNGRVAAIRRAYETVPERAAAYRASIEARGIDTTGFQRPVLVRRRTTELTPTERAAWAREANERDTMAMSSAEQAAADAKAMTDVTLQLYRGGHVADAGNREFFRSFLRDAVPPGEHNAMIGSDGRISNDGIRRARAALLAKAYDDGGIITKIVEDPNTNVKAMGDALSDAAPAMAKLRAAIAAGDTIPEYDISPNVTEAVDMVSRSRENGQSIAGMLNQVDAFAPAVSDNTRAVLRLLFRDEGMTKPRSGAKVAKALREYADAAMKPEDNGLFGSIPKPGPLAALNAAREGVEDATGGQGDMLPSTQTGGLPDFMAGVILDIARTAGNVRDALAELAYMSDANIADMAKRLMAIVGDVKIDVLSNAEMIALLKRKTKITLPDGASVGGLYSNDTRTISLNGDRPGRYVVLHEAAHAATSDAINNMTRDGRRMIAIYDRFRRYRQDEYGFTNPHEFVAEVWSNPAFRQRIRTLTDDGKVGNLWQRLVNVVSRIVGGKNADFVEQVLEASEAAAARQNGKSGGTYPSIQGGPPNPDSQSTWQRILRLALDPDITSDQEIQRVTDTFGDPKAAARSLLRVVEAPFHFFFANDSKARLLAARFNAPSFTEYADMFHARAGAPDSTSRDYHSAVRYQDETRRQKLYQALKPFLGDAEAMSRIRDRLTRPNARQRMTQDELDAARDVAALLKDTLAYRRKAGEDIGEVTDGYVPRVISQDRAVKGREAFLQAAEKLYRNHGMDAAEAKIAAGQWFAHIFDTYAGLDGGLQFARSGTTGIGSSSAQAREFGKQADVLLKDFYEPDLFQLLSNYIHGSAMRAEQTRRFGKPGTENSPERKAWEKEHGDKTQMEELQDRMKAEIVASGESVSGALHQLKTIHDSNLGKLGSQNPRTREIVSRLHLWNQISKLDRVTITSLGELTMGFIRGGPSRGLPYIRDSMKEAARLIAGSEPSDAARYAESYGVIKDAVVTSHLASLNSSDNVSGAWSQKLLNGFYRTVGLHQFSTGQRIAAATMAREMLRSFAGDLSSPSARVKKRADLYLREFGISDPQAFADRLLRQGEPTAAERAADEGFANEYTTAIIRGVEQTQLNPSRAEKPSYASHPIGSLFFALSGYSYAFKKNVLDRVARLGVQAFKDRDPALLIPAMSLALMAMAQDGIDTYLKPLLFGSNYKFEDEDGLTHMLRVADRAGFTGALSPFVNAIKGVRYDRSLLESLSGSIVGQIANLGQKLVELGVRNSDDTNTAERNAAAAVYDVFVKPATNIAIVASRALAVVKTPAIMASGSAGKGGVFPSPKEAFVSSVAGPKEE